MVTASRAQDDRLARYKTQYAQETDPVRKAKLLGAMAPLEVDQSRVTYKAGNDEQSLDILTGYIGEVQKTLMELKATGADPVKHPAGFKELQIGLRVGLRRLDDFVLEIPVDKQPWFSAARSDFADAQNALIDDLFQIDKKNPDRAAQNKQP